MLEHENLSTSRSLRERVRGEGCLLSSREFWKALEWIGGDVVAARVQGRCGDRGCRVSVRERNRKGEEEEEEGVGPHAADIVDVLIAVNVVAVGTLNLVEHDGLA